MNQEEAEENSIFQNQEEGLDYYVKKLKKIIFDVLFVLMSDEEGEEEDISQMYIETSIDYIQMLGFPFNQNVFQVWKDDYLMSLIFKNYLPNIGYTAFLVSMYLLEGVIFLMILDIIYVSYSFSRKRFAVMWPLYLLRSGTRLMVTVLFLPITETLTNVFNCNKNAQGVIILYFYPQIVCFQSWHLFHTATSLFTILLFVIVSTVVSYAYFEPRMNSGNRTARQHSKAEVSIIMNKVICQCLYNILTVILNQILIFYQSTWQLIVITFVLSIWLFYAYNYQDPYYDREVALFFNIMTSYYLWTTFMLLISQIFYDTSFNGGLLAWIIGLPFIGVIMILARNSRIDALIRSQNKFRTGEQIQDHLRYVLQLIQQQKTDKNAFMLLVGYIEKHKEICLDDDCPFKQRKVKNNFKQGIEEEIRNLIYELEKAYVSGLDKFPKCTKLRLSYAFFLLERMKNKNKAYEQLLIAEKRNPAFDEQFIIYRYKKIIKENAEESEENADIVSLIAFDNHMQQWEEYMKLSCHLQIRFWGELREEQPDLDKLKIIGSRISTVVTLAKENYISMQKINPNIPQTIKLFGKFTLNVLNDKSRGFELLKQAKKLKKQISLEQIKEPKDYSSFPCLISSAKKNQLGIILSINPLFTTMFGYHKEDIVCKEISHIMPQFYHHRHEIYLKRFFENYLSRLRNQDVAESNYLDSDQRNFIKLSTGFIFPVIYKVNINTENMTFQTTFKCEATTKIFIYFIVNNYWLIEDASSGVLNYFDLSYRDIQEKKISLIKLIPEIKELKNEVCYKKAGVENYIWFKVDIQPLKIGKRIEVDESDSEENINRKPDKHKVIKLELLDKRTQTSSNPSIDQFEKKSKSSSTIRKSTRDMKTSIEIDQSLFYFMKELYQSKTQDEYQDFFNHQTDQPEIKFENYQEEIKTKRLIDGQIRNIDVEKEEEFLKQLEEEEQENPLFGATEQFQDQEEFRIFHRFNLHGLITKAINTYHQYSIITKFKILSFIWVIFVATMTILQYYYSVQYLESHKNDINLIQIVNLKLVDLNTLVSKILNLIIINDGRYAEKFDLTEAIFSLKNITSSLVEFDKVLSTNKFNMFLNQYTRIVNFRFYNDDLTYNEKNISLQSAFMIMVSYAINITNTHNCAISDPYVQGILYNYYHSILDGLILISNQLYNEVNQRMKNSPENALIIILIILIVVSISTLVLFINLMYFVKVKRENILFLFLDIPLEHVNRLQRKCENFMKHYFRMRGELLIKSQEEVSDDEIVEQDNEEIHEFLKNSQKRKKIIQKYQKNKLKGNQGMIIQFLIVVLFTFVFAIFNMIQTIQMRMEVQFLLPQFYQNSFLVNVYAQYMNTQKLMMIDYEYKIQGVDIIKINQDRLEDFTGNTQKLRTFLLALLSKYQAFRDLYMQLQFGDVCKAISNQIDSLSDCYSIINSNMEMGLASVEQFYLEYYRVNLLSFQDQPQKFSPLLSSPVLQETENSLFIYFKQAVVLIIRKEMEMIFSQINQNERTGLILVIVFLSLLLIAFMAFWLPYLNNLNIQINKTIEMLNMVPMNVIKQNKSIRSFVKDLIISMDNICI